MSKVREGLWPHQLKTVEGLSAMPLPRRLLAYEMGCGKTRTAASAIEEHANGGGYYFVICPKAVTGVWLNELSDKRYKKLVPVVLDKRYRRLKVPARLNWLKDHATRADANGNSCVFILNYELLNCASNKRQQAAGMFALGWPPRGIVFDESHWLAGASSARSKSAVKIVGKMDARSLVLCLSGTPVTTCPLSIFTQAKLIKSSVFGESFYAFQKRHTIYKTIYVGGEGRAVPDEVVGLDIINSGIEEFADVVKCADVQTFLPDVVNQVYSFEIECRKAYDEVKRDCITKFDQGYLTADNALESWLRLRMLTSGIATIDDDETITVDDSRANVLSELLNMAQPSAPSNPVIVFYEFKAELKQIESVCRGLALRFGAISGADKSGLHEATGTLAEGFDVVAVQLNAGTVGVDLTAASVCVFYRHPVRGWHVLDQAIKRLHRPGQKNVVRCLHVIASNTIDVQIYNALKDQRNVAEFLINNIREV